MVVLDFGAEKDTILNCQSKKQHLIKKNSDKATIESAFNFCRDCHCESSKMSCMPPTMFMAKKVRENDEKLVLARIKNGDGPNSQQYFNTKLMELSPLKYNSKLMNSIWGLYNRYSPHNIKRTNDDLFNFFGGLQESSAGSPRNAAPRDAAPLGKSPPKQGQNLPKIENLWSNIHISQSH